MEEFWKSMDEKEFKLYSNNIREKILENEVYLTLERYARQAPKKETRDRFRDYMRLIVHRKMDEKTYNNIARAIEEMDYMTHDMTMIVREQSNIYQTI